MLYWNVNSDGTLTVVPDHNSPPLTTTKSNPNWDKILTALRQNQGDEVVRLMSIKDAMMDYFDGKISIRGNQVWYGNQTLHGRDVERTLELMRINVPVGPMVKFLNNKMNNPSRRAVDEMYNFLTNPAVDKNGGMPITPNGTILGYKGVRADYYSIMGNPATVVLQGTVDSGGHILNEIGATIEVARNSVCDNYKNGCAEGLHIGSREYAEGWAGPDGKVILVEFSPEDAVSVPEDCGFQKLRACKYVVRGECQREVQLSTTYTEDYTPSDDDGVRMVPNWDDDYEREQDEQDEQDEQEEQEEQEELDELESSEKRAVEYDRGYQAGELDGLRHKARSFSHEQFVSSRNDPHFPWDRDYVQGYQDGYSRERQRQQRRDQNKTPDVF